MNKNNPPLRVAAATSRDAPEIVAAVREGFADELLQLFIYGCQGMSTYVAEQIALQESGGEMRYTVARCGETLMAAVELRRCPNTLFLNYIVVRPAFQGQGMASRILRAALIAAGADRRGKLTLDVLEHNLTARNWYERLGFCAEAMTSWWTLPLSSGATEPVIISGYPQAQACQRAYGFSQFQVTTGGAVYDVGRLGEEWFRISNPEAVDAPGLTATLHQLDANRRLLVLAPDSWVPRGTVGKPAARTCRMTVDLEVLLPQLDRDERPRKNKPPT